MTLVRIICQKHTINGIQSNFGKAMDHALKIELGSLAGHYVPTAVYFQDSDCVEYVTHDALCVYDRVDSFLTVIYDEFQKTIIGFKLKGFSKAVKTVLGAKGSHDQFLQLVKVIEQECQKLGDNMFDEKRSYLAVQKMAANDNNCVLDREVLLPLLKAA
ncbi:MAG: hypothetical protein LCH46_01850 [Proteobacteria bacterium]|nr:hypothetical protein [Pseudomonadota bacterium]